MFAALGRVPVPVVAVVAGRAWGVGCALAAACDVTIATVGATFCLPEMKRSIPPTLALSALRDLVPYKRLMHFVLTSTVVTANDAVGLGVVSTVVTEESLDETVNEFLKHLRSTERLSLLTVKRYLRSTVRMEGMAAAELASALLAGALASLPQS
jgi:enoyl-CoA hydratase/carnithine racemase